MATYLSKLEHHTSTVLSLKLLNHFSIYWGVIRQLIMIWEGEIWGGIQWAQTTIIHSCTSQMKPLPYSRSMSDRQENT